MSHEDILVIFVICLFFAVIASLGSVKAPEIYSQLVLPNWAPNSSLVDRLGFPVRFDRHFARNVEAVQIGERILNCLTLCDPIIPERCLVLVLFLLRTFC